jgi:hypothetical protein
MKIRFTFYTADDISGSWDIESAGAFTRPYGFEIDLITNAVEILEY